MFSVSNKVKEENIQRLDEQYEQEQREYEQELAEEISVNSDEASDDKVIDVEFSYTTCTDPMCDCGALYLHDINNEEVVIPVNVHDKKLVRPQDLINPTEGSPELEAVMQSIERKLTNKHWQNIRDIYFEEKIKIIDKVNPNHIYFEFDEKDILDEELMFSYFDIFPCSPLTLEIGDRRYVMIDTYCKNDLCNCNNIMLTVYNVTDMDFHDKRIGELNTYEYNYKFKTGSFSSNIDQEEAQEVIDAYFLEYPDLDNILRKRNSITRKLFKKSKKEYWSSNQYQASAKPVSRNAPCPCGSGKKYKRCCGK